TNDVICLAFGPDNKLLASGGRDPAVRVWDLATGKEQRKFDGPTADGARSAVTALVFTRDGKAIFGGSSGVVLRWDVAGTAKPVVKGMRGGGSTVAALALSADGRTLAYALNGANNPPGMTALPGAPVMAQPQPAGPAHQVGFFVIDGANLTEAAQ